MSVAPDLAMQAAVVATLKADAGLIAEFGGTPRVYDRVPDPPTFPYIHIGDDQVVDMESDCHALSEVFVTVHVWSRAVGKVEAKRIGALIRPALNAGLTVTGFSVRNFEFLSANYYDDPDPSTTHGVIQFRYEVQPTT